MTRGTKRKCAYCKNAFKGRSIRLFCEKHGRTIQHWIDDVGVMAAYLWLYREVPAAKREICWQIGQKDIHRR